MIELGVTPVRTRLSPCSVALREFITNSDGTISGLTAVAGVPIVFIEDDVGAACPNALTIPVNAMETPKSPASAAVLVLLVISPSYSSTFSDALASRICARRPDARGDHGRALYV